MSIIAKTGSSWRCVNGGMRLIVPGLVILLAGMIVGAQQREVPDGFSRTYGIPSEMSCATYLRATGAERASYDWWLLGFVSGADYAFGRAAARRFRPTDVQGIVSAVEKFCRERPTAQFGESGMVVVESLGG